jgi:hypothetical protein
LAESWFDVGWLGLAALGAVLLSVAWRSVQDRRRIPARLQATAERLEGRVVEGRSRPSIAGSFEGRGVVLRFPVRWAAAADQAMEVEFDVTPELAGRVGRKHPREDLLRLGVSPLRLDAATTTERLDWLFRVARARDLVFHGGRAHVTLSWGWREADLDPSRVVFAVAQVWQLVEDVAGERSTGSTTT